MYTVQDFKRDVRMGNYGDGGYPLYFLTSDGDTLHPKCARKEAKEIIRALMDGDRGRIVAHDANWEDPELYCEACGERIESAYAENYVPRPGAVYDGEGPCNLDRELDPSEWRECMIALVETTPGIHEGRYEELVEVYETTRKGGTRPVAVWIGPEKNKIGQPIRTPILLVCDELISTGPKRGEVKMRDEVAMYSQSKRDWEAIKARGEYKLGVIWK